MFESYETVKGLANSQDLPALLVVNFGVSYSKPRKDSIDKLVQRVRLSYPDHKVVMAFTSEMIRSKLKRRGEEVFNTVEALAHLKEEGFRRVVVQPTHLMAGSEFHKMYRMIQAIRTQFDRIEVGNPLLTHHDDYVALATILNKTYPIADSETALVLMGHGSEHPSNACYPALNYECAYAGYPHIITGTVEGFPELDDVVKMLERQRFKKIILAPLLFVAGDHAQNDMASDDEDSWKSQLVKRGYHVELCLKGLGEIEAVQAMYLDHLADAYSRINGSVRTLSL